MLVEVHGSYKNANRRGAAGRLGVRLRAASIVLHALYARDAAPLAIAGCVRTTRYGAQHARRWCGRRRRGPGRPWCSGLLTQDADDALMEKQIRVRSRDESRFKTAAPPATSTRSKSTARSTTPSAAAMPSISSRGRLQSSSGDPAESTTWGCSPAPTISTCCAARARGRDIDRHYYTPIELQRALAQPVVQSLLALLQMRNTTFRARFT